MSQNPTFTRLLPSLPPELHEPFANFTDSVGHLCQAFAEMTDPKPEHMGVMMSYVTSRIMTDTALSMECIVSGKEKPDALAVKLCIVELIKLTSKLCDHLVRDDVQEGFLTESAPCDCPACKLKRKLESGEKIKPSELAALLQDVMNDRKQPNPTPEPEHVTGTPSQSSPWYVGLGSEEQVLGSPLQVSPGEDQPSPSGGDSSDGKGRLATD